MVIAYLRVSTEKQLIENQHEEVKQFAKSKGLKITKWHVEKVSGTIIKEKRKLESILCSLRANDILIVSEISRLSRTMLEIMNILDLCIKKEVTLYSVKEGYSFENNMTSKIMGFAFGIAAEIERNLIASRTREALAYRKSQGMILGRPTGSAPQKEMLVNNSEEIRYMIRRGVPKIRIADKFKVSKATLYNFLKEVGEKE